MLPKGQNLASLLRGSVTKSKVGESERFCDAKNESGRRISPTR